MDEGAVIKKKKLKTQLIEVKKPSFDEKRPKSHNLILGTKYKKDPLPMKLRALPQSFWQQPNTLTEFPPATYIPPLYMEAPKMSKCEVVGVENVELLFSLFQCVEHENREVKLKGLRGMTVKGERSRKKKKQMKSYRWTKHDSDPYFTAGAIPFIPVKEDQILAQGQQVLAMISMRSKDKSLPVVHSYSERLSDFVINL